MPLPFSKYAHKTARADYLIRVCIRYKHIRDTVKTCNRQHQAWGPYVHGQIEPHFSVPSVMGEVFIGCCIVSILRSEVRLWDGSVIEWLKEDV